MINMMFLKFMGLILLMQGPPTPPQHQTLLSGLREAGQSDKGLILYFSSSTCTACAPWEAFLERKDIQSAIQPEYVKVEVNMDDFDGKACSQIYEVKSAPALVIVDKAGKILYKDETSLRELALIQFLQNPKSISQAKREDVDAAPQLAISSPPEKPAVTEQPATSSPGGSDLYFVQTGFFGNAENALRMQDELGKAGFDNVVIKTETRDGSAYNRVLIGGFANETSATRVLETCKTKGIAAKLYQE